MKRIYQSHEDYDRKYTSEEFSCLKYYSKKAMKKMYPNHGYIVIGAVGDGLDAKAHTFEIDDQEHDYYHLKFSKVRYAVDGYIDCGDDCYIAVVKNHFAQHLMGMLIILMLIAGLLFGGYMLMKDRISVDPNITDYDPKITLPDNADPNRIAVPGYDKLKMIAGTDQLYAALWNPDTNPCYFKFTIILDDDDSMLYESGLVPPGKAITTVKLKKKLETEGSYPVTIRMDTYSLEDGKTPMNSGTSKTVINVVKE